MAEFPEESPDGLIPLWWVEESIQRWHDNANLPLTGQEILFSDPGRSEKGDPRCFLRRKGRRVLNIERQQGMSLMDTTGRLKIEYERGAAIGVDVMGIGAGVGDRLDEQGVYYTAYKGSARCDKTDRSGHIHFPNLRSWAYWAVREALDPNGEVLLELPPDDLLKADLTTPKYSHMSGGMIRVEPKDDVMKRLGRSPDTGDALAGTEAVNVSPMPVDIGRNPRPLMHRPLMERIRQAKQQQQGGVFSSSGFTLRRQPGMYQPKPTKTDDKGEK